MIHEAVAREHGGGADERAQVLQERVRVERRRQEHLRRGLRRHRGQAAVDVRHVHRPLALADLAFGHLQAQSVLLDEDDGRPMLVLELVQRHALSHLSGSGHVEHKERRGLQVFRDPLDHSNALVPARVHLRRHFDASPRVGEAHLAHRERQVARGGRRHVRNDDRLRGEVDDHELARVVVEEPIDVVGSVPVKRSR